MREEKSAVIGLENFPKTSESNLSQIDNILKEKFTSLIHKETSKVSNSKLAKIAIEHCPIDLAYAVSHLPPNARPHLFENLPDSESRIKFIVNTDNRTKHFIFKFMKDADIKKMIDKMPTDDAIDVLDVLSERRLKRVLDVVNPQKSKHIKEQKKHRRNTAGRLMTDDFFAFVKEMTIKEASSYIRDFPHIDFTKGIFIVDEKNELVGYVPGRNLVINSKDALLKQIMRPVEHKTYIKTSREEIVSIFERYKISSLPIINENNKLVGIISDDIALELMEDLADETLSQIGGTEESGGTKDPIFQRFLARAPWLLVTLIAGLINMQIMSGFEKMVGGFLTFILFFVPLITGMSGNIGIQCSTVLVRSIALGMFLKNKKDAILKELSVGIFSGLIFGVVCGIIIFIISLIFPEMINASPAILGTIVGAGLIGACFVGTFLGVFSPLFFSRIGVDPAIASGPIVAAFNDVVSMAIYFVISWGLASIFF